MILKTLKEKSNQKYINKLLTKRRGSVNTNKIDKIAVLLNADEYDNFEVFRAYFKKLGLYNCKIIAFTAQDKIETHKLEAYCNPKDFGWNGKLKNNHLETFCEAPFDVLISYYKNETTQLSLITAASKANFKIGISNKDERLYDLIIDVIPNDISIFKKEFEKYLNILNKL
ncbi:MAG: DUF6913 domain-containing protein [Winogradskyella sp.]